MGLKDGKLSLRTALLKTGTVFYHPYGSGVPGNKDI